MGERPIGRPRRESAARVTTAIRFPPDVHERLVEAAEEREVSMNFLVVRAVRELLDNLIPVAEVQWTRRNGAAPPASEPSEEKR